MGRALSREARLMIMDEPSAVLAHDEVANLFRVIRGLTAQGIAVIYISHRLDEIRDIGDRVTVLKDGRTTAANLPAAVGRRVARAAVLVAAGVPGVPRPNRPAEAVSVRQAGGGARAHSALARPRREDHPAGRSFSSTRSVLMPEEEASLRLALATLDRLPDVVEPPLEDALRSLVRQSRRLAELLSQETADAGITQVRLVRTGGELPVPPGADAALRSLFRDGAEPELLPLTDWRARAVPSPFEPDECFALLPGDPAEPGTLGAAATAGGRAYPALRSGELLVIAARGWMRSRLRTAQCAVTDPVSFALLAGREVADFPNAPGWSIQDSAERAVDEHRGWLQERPEEPDATGEALGRLLAAVRAAQFWSSVKEGEPALPLTLADAGRFSPRATREYARSQNRRAASTRPTGSRHTPSAATVAALRRRCCGFRLTVLATRIIPDGSPCLGLTAIVPATKRPGDARAVRAAIEAATAPPEEIIVVDRPSSAGPAEARNAGARRAWGDVLVFVDADVLVHRDAFIRIRAAFESDPGLGGVFGSYDDEPATRGGIRVSEPPAPPRAPDVAWARRHVLGRARRDQEGGLPRGRRLRQHLSGPSIEDVELGLRLTDAGHRIELVPDIQGKRLKEWTLLGMIRCDVLHRAVPWLALLLRRGRSSAALNLSWRHRVSALASVGIAGAVAARRYRGLVPVAALMIALNHAFYGLLWRSSDRAGCARRGLHVVHHLSAVAARRWPSRLSFRERTERERP